MGILSWILLGLEDPGGIIVTTLIGIAGAFLGGYAGTQLGIGAVSGFNLVSIGLAVAGALILLFAYRILFKKRKTSGSGSPSI